MFGIKKDFETLRRGGLGVSKAIETLPPTKNLGRFLGGENTRLLWL